MRTSLNLKFLFINLFLGLFFSTNLAFASLSTYYDYFNEYKDTFGIIGDYQNGEMELITDINSAMQAEENYLNFFLKRGVPLEQAREFSKLGVVAEDSRWIWIRDPIRLPSGETTGYNRFLPKCALGGVHSVSILAISEQKEILVNLIYRHATREWEIELPRGGNDSKEDAEAAARRELREETGYLAETIFKISSVASDSGIISNHLDIFFAKDLINEYPDREAEELILKCEFIPKDKLKEGFIKGTLELKSGNKTIHAKCRDAFLASALMVAEYKNLI